MTKAQKEYMYWKSVVETLGSEEDALEAEYCRENGLTNENGAIVTHIWQIDDDATFEFHNARFAENGGQDALDKKIEAQKHLTNAEDALIEEGLTFA